MDRHQPSKNPTILNKDNLCYICKRTEAEVREFLLPALDDAETRYNSETAEIESKLQNMENNVRSYLDNILKSTEKDNLDFKIEAVMEDIDSFKKIIPRVEDLIKNADWADHHYSIPKRGQTLLDIRNKLLKIRKDIDGKKIYQILVQDRHVDSNKIIECNEVEVSDAWKPYVSHSTFSNLLESLTDLLKTYEKNIEEKSHRSSLSKYQKKTIETIKHRKITRQIKSTTTYSAYEVDSGSGWGTSTRSGDPDVTCTTDFSFNVCAICYTLVWHETGSSLSSIFREESKPVLQEGEKFIRTLNDSEGSRF